MRIGFLCGILLCGIIRLEAQESVWINRGAVIRIAPGCIVSGDADLIIDSLATFVHSGDFLLKGELKNSGSMQLNGNWSQTGDIINDGSLIAWSGIFSLTGDTQIIAGSGKTAFAQLNLTGNGLKMLQQDVETSTLSLNDRRLQTGSFKMIVQSNLPEAIQRQSGYVCSDSGGALFRSLQVGLTYLFPVGGDSTYAPLMLSPTERNDTIGVRFANVDASSENLFRQFVPTDICLTNALFFSTIQRADTGKIEVGLVFDKDLAAPYNTVLSTKIGEDVLWKERGMLEAGSNGFTKQISFQSQGVQAEALLLGRKRPFEPVIIAEDALCLFETIELTASNSGVINWMVSGGKLITSGETASFTSEQEGVFIISATQTDSLGCSSFPALKELTVFALPKPGIEIVQPSYPYEDQLFKLKYNGDSAGYYRWSQEGSLLGNDRTLDIAFDQPGTYPIELRVVNENGCARIQDTMLVVIPGLELPDSFSPNGDGINDELVFLNSGLQRMNLQIFNRWGKLVFQSISPKFNWDGRDQNGELVPAGTYLYVLEAATSEHEYKHQGSITVLY